MDESINNSKEYYRVLFCTVLTLLEVELAFTKFAPLITLQESRTQVTNDKLNSTIAAEMASISCEIITSTVLDYCNENRFTSLSGDDNEAGRTAEAKELVFLWLYASDIFAEVSTFKRLWRCFSRRYL